MANSYTVNGKGRGVSIDDAINDALKKVKPSGVTDQLITLKITEIK